MKDPLCGRDCSGKPGARGPVGSRTCSGKPDPDFAKGRMCASANVRGRPENPANQQPRTNKHLTIFAPKSAKRK
jgi:hypothetical protein